MLPSHSLGPVFFARTDHSPHQPYFLLTYRKRVYGNCLEYNVPEGRRPCRKHQHRVASMGFVEREKRYKVETDLRKPTFSIPVWNLSFNFCLSVFCACPLWGPHCGSVEVHTDHLQRSGSICEICPLLLLPVIRLLSQVSNHLDLLSHLTSHWPKHYYFATILLNSSE